ncbi:DUF938 domain-containing protein [Endozoicomonadaceae bacterium StTr2]
MSSKQDKPFSQACENNKKPILDVLQHYFKNSRKVLEIGTGTGQHAVHFARHMPFLQWQPTDLSENLSGQKLWFDEAQLPNLMSPLALDVLDQNWPVSDFDAVFSANTAHIMPWAAVEAMFSGIGKRICNGGVFCQYGPFNYQGHFTSDSNARFDEFLKQRASHMGIRNFEDVEQLAGNQNFELQKDIAMPANNKLIVWKKI